MITTDQQTNCIFCQIIQKKIPATIFFQDEYVTAFQDIHPVTPVHILIVPNRHIRSINETQAEDAADLGRLMVVAGVLAKKYQIDQSGYRLMVNTGDDAGQSVYHLHLHLLGGRRMHLP